MIVTVPVFADETRQRTSRLPSRRMHYSIPPRDWPSDLCPAKDSFQSTMKCRLPPRKACSAPGRGTCSLRAHPCERAASAHPRPAMRRAGAELPWHCCAARSQLRSRPPKRGLRLPAAAGWGRAAVASQRQTQQPPRDGRARQSIAAQGEGPATEHACAQSAQAGGLWAVALVRQGQRSARHASKLLQC